MGVFAILIQKNPQDSVSNHSLVCVCSFKNASLFAWKSAYVLCIEPLLFVQKSVLPDNNISVNYTVNQT